MYENCYKNKALLGVKTQDDRLDISSGSWPLQPHNLRPHYCIDDGFVERSCLTTLQWCVPRWTTSSDEDESSVIDTRQHRCTE